ncbi:MAG: serine--tRNA ligase [Planctomyces sp.]|jgi:seryl-tRNA synthetase|nr:serine--tRNA ligase [Planctomyces sp.]GDX91360.1 serine--tRNA ligase [Planctomycetia bacterium]HAV31511.1 serine--tRNA ligase [Planctomycetaceae bacterium]HBC61687.1 serine--tRNA ligase [Planctomycetaceae bacterium]
MLDLQFICDHRDEVVENCKKRGVQADVDAVIRLRDQRNALIVRGDEIRRQQKDVSARIPKAAADERPALIEQGKVLRDEVSAIDEQLRVVEEQLRSEQARIPNLTHPEAPIGGEADAREIRVWGRRPEFSFPVKDHVELAAGLDLIDFEAGARVAGSGFYFLKNDAVLLEMALVQFALTKLRGEGFTLFTTPDLARDSVLEGIGFTPRGSETQIYSVADTDLSLVATAEITLGGIQKDQTLEQSVLPLKYAGLSHCFRTEAGAAGRATRGIYRVHQFTKVEMFGYAGPDVKDSDALHQEILRIEEEIFQALGIPYRVIDTASGDLGGPAYRKFDIEAWMPGRGEYGEVTSASNCTDYQARRLNIRCRSQERKGTQYVHTLNGTAISCARAIIAVLENYQQEDGTVVVPEVLRPWVGRDVLTRK